MINQEDISGGSRISRRGSGPARGAWTSEAGTFRMKMFAKTKELGPVGGRAPGKGYTYWLCETSCNGTSWGTRHFLIDPQP